ncbi:hypothetical protein [Streptomyces sp. NPDC093984]
MKRAPFEDPAKAAAQLGPLVRAVIDRRPRVAGRGAGSGEVSA